jgi:alkylation response protein AidB-like acyl-CoA dehydrogenase
VAAVTAEVQAAKAFLGDAAVRVVDRAMALSGGAGYLNTHPLAKAYRDARAAAFMHPMGANRAMDFIARTSIGLAPLPG